MKQPKQIDRRKNRKMPKRGFRPEMTVPGGQATINSLFLTIKQSAIRRNYAFELNFDTFKLIACNNCFYCDTPPPRKNKYCNAVGVAHKGLFKHGYTQMAIDRSWVNINGIDRYDNNIGYTVSNCVPCCGNCNKMKTEMGPQEFLNKIAKILSRKDAILARLCQL